MTQDMKVYGKFTDMFKYSIKGTAVLRNLFLTLTLMILGATNVLAQTDFSGTYYIRSTGKNASNTNLYYLCPT